MSEVWREPTRRLEESAPFRELLRPPCRVRRLPVAAAAWVAERLRRRLGRPLLVLVPGEAEAQSWVEAAALFGGRASFFSAPGLTPYQQTETSLVVRAQEAIALRDLLWGRVEAVVCTPRALFRRLPGRELFERAVLRVEPDSEIAPEDLAEHLSSFGFERRDLVTEVGEYAVRGGVFDLFPPGEPRPVRLDLFGDTVESIRRFSPDDQRSREGLEAVEVVPLSHFPAGPGEAERLADLLASRPGASSGPEAAETLETLRRRGRFPGWLHYLPLLAERTLDLPALLGEPLRVALEPQALRAEVEQHRQRLAADYETRRRQGRLAVPPEELEHPAAGVLAALGSSELTIGGLGDEMDGPAVDFESAMTDLFHGQLPRFPREVETAAARRERLLLVCTAEHRPRLEDFCRTVEVPLGAGGVELVEGELQRGFRLPAAGVVVFGERQLFARLAPDRPRRGPRYGPFLTGLRDLRVGDYVVHTDHGIGQFVGLRSVGGEERGARPLPKPLGGFRAAGEGTTEVMEIHYDSGRSLLLPLSRMDLIQRYSGVEGLAPRLDKLGGSSWTRTKDRVKAGMLKMAGDLLKLYAERQLAGAPAMPAASDLMSQFAAAFDYEETPHQIEAIEAIMEDLRRERPMDRLLCGDVGFGKTEVAMRAAFQVVEGGYQVAVLAPTTILADQHLETFSRRFDGFPVRIEMISRFRSPREIRDVRRRLERGEVDVLIGTHRLLSRDVRIPRLGLLIVDEEQRFGVAQKERLKELKKNVHVLALSATPVPRTLQLSLAGVRDLSIIETPPRDRMAVETAIAPFSGELVREAIEHELERGGQVYYVYNRVQGIEKMAGYLDRLLPGLRLTVGHGQMDEAELSRRMHAFKAGDYDVLLATTIIENGIDISNVNTMLVHRADRFGLAQLYQLRGRVGRSSLLAYCYLLVPESRVLSATARQRLEAIREFTELGAGFRVAARDLEIRGAGNLLGPEQSGHIAAVGIDTYLRMLEETVRELRGEEVAAAPSAAIDLPVSMNIPSEYIADANLRLEIYRKIAAGDGADEEILSELRDRFGPPPDPVLRLVEAASLKRLAESLRIQSISARGGRLTVRLRRDTRVDVERLIRLVSESPGASFSPTGVLTLSGLPPERLVVETRATLERLSP